MNSMKNWSLAALMLAGTVLGSVSGMAQVTETLQLSVDPSTLVWLAGQQDVTVKVSLSNTGSAINIYSGSFYVGVTGPGNPKIWDVKLAGLPGAPAGTFLVGPALDNPFVQTPLQNSDPDADAQVSGAEPVSSYNTAAIQIMFDMVKGTSVAQEIPGNTTAPFAEITFRRSDLNSIGPWTINLFNTHSGTSPSFVVMPGGSPGDQVQQNMSLTSGTIVAVPEPESIAAAVGLALVAVRLLRRTPSASPR